MAHPLSSGDTVGHPEPDGTPAATPAPAVLPLAPTAGGRLGVVAGGAVLPARWLDGVGPAAAGRQALVVFDGGDPTRPVVVGLVAVPIEGLVDLDGPPAPAEPATADASDPPPLSVWADGREVRVEATHRIELRCGEASLTLRADGKVEVRGTHILSRSSGPHRIKGGSVDIN